MGSIIASKFNFIGITAKGQSDEDSPFITRAFYEGYSREVVPGGPVVTVTRICTIIIVIY